MNDATIFQATAVCLTKIGPDSGQTVCRILHRKELERRSGKDEHEHEFWWGFGEKGRVKSIVDLINVYNAQSIIFVPNKIQHLKETPRDILVWRQYLTIDGHQGIIPEHALVTSSTTRTEYFALVCKSQKSLLLCNSSDGRGFANRHYRYLEKSGKLGESYGRGQHTTSPLVRCPNVTAATTAADCDSAIEFSADFARPNCVRLCDSKSVPFARIDELKVIRDPYDWLSAVAIIRE
jgi:hypothetical protein